MQKLNDDDVVSCSPTSVSSGYCSQWMSPYAYGSSSKQSASERTICTESEFESDHGVNQKFLTEFHSIPSKTRRGRSKLLPSGVQVTKRKLTCARQHRKSVQHESEVLKCLSVQSDLASFPHKQTVVQSSSPDLPLRGLAESCLKWYSLNSGHAYKSDKLLASEKPSLSGKRSKRGKNCLTSLGACKSVRYLTVSICRLPSGIKSIDVKNIRNSSCYFQNTKQVLDFKDKHRRTDNSFKQLQSSRDIRQVQSNSNCKQLQSCSYLKPLHSQSLKQHTSKSKRDVKHAKLNQNKILMGVERHHQSKNDVNHLRLNKCKDSLHEADIEEDHRKVTEVKQSGGVLQNSRSVFVKDNHVESYKCNVERMQYAVFTKTNSQNPVSLCKASDLNRPLKKTLNHEQCLVKVTHTTYRSKGRSKVLENQLSNCVSTSGFCTIKNKLDSHVSAGGCRSIFSSVMHDRKPRDTLENWIKTKHSRRKVKCGITGRSDCRCRRCHWRPCHSAFRRFHQPTPVLCKHVSPRACYKQGSRKSTETHPNGVLANEADETLSSHNSPHIIDIQNEREVRPDRRNLFEIFLKEIPSTSQQNLIEEIASKPEMSAIQNNSSSSSNTNSSSHLNSCVKLDYSAKDLDLCEPSDPSVQPRTENSSLTELFEPSAPPLLDTNDDMYSDISDDVLPDAVSTTYDMFSDISDCIPNDIPVNESTNGDASSDMSKNILPDLYSLWLQSRCFNPLTSSMSLESIKTNPIESRNERSQETPQTPEDSSCSDNRNHILNCQKPCSTAIANNPPVSDNRCHTEIQTNNSSPRRPCSFIVTAISEGLHCFEIEEDDSLCKRCSCSDIQTLEASSPSERHWCFIRNQISEIPCSAESMTDSSQGEKPCSLGVNPATAPFTSDSVGPFSTNVQERSSPTSPGAAEESMAASREPCSNKEQRFHSCGVPCSNQIQTGISPLNSLDMSQKSEMFTSEGLCSTESDETMLNSTVHYFSTVESTNEGSVAPRLQEETTSSSSIQDESAFGLQSSVEIPERTLTCEIPERTLACEEPCHLLETQRRLSITKEIVCVQNKSPICEHSSTEIRGKVCTTPCSVATQKGVSISENTVSFQLQNELLAVGSRNMLETIHNSDGLWLNNVSKENLTYEGPSEFDVNDEGILRSGDALVVGISFSEEEGPVVSEICDAKEGHSVLGATYSEEDSLVSDETCFKDGPLTSKGSCCKVGPLASEVILEDSSSRGELLTSEEPSCNERPLVSEEPVSNTGPYMSDLTTVSDLSWNKEERSTSEATCSDHITESPCLDVILKDILTPEAKFSDDSNEGSVIPLEVSGFNVLQSELTGGPWEGFSSVQEFEDLLTAGVGSCLSETNDGSVNLEDLFPFVLQAPSQVFAEPLNYEDYLSCEMHKNTPVESQINSTQENSLIAESSSTATFQEEFANPEIRKDLLISGNSSSKDSQESNSNEINSNHLDTSSKPKSFLAKFHEFTNAWRPSAAASESENDADNRHHDDAIDSLDETRNECISDANRTSCGTDPFISAVTIPQCSARAKTESWLREYQSQMLENQQRKHKNWKLLVSVIDDRKPGGRRGGQQRSALGNRSRKRNCSPRTNKTRHQPKKFCSIDSVTSTCNSEQTEPKEDFLVLQNDVCNVDLTSHLNFSVDGVMATFQNMVLNGDPSVLSRFIDQANTWLSVENTETTIDQEQFGHSGPNIHSEPESTTPLSRFTSDSGATLGVAPEQPEGTMPIELPGLALNSETSTDEQSVSMLSVDYGNIESMNVLSSDPGNVLQTVVPGFTGVGSELDPEMLQYLLSMILQSDSSELLPGISYSQSNEAVTHTDVNRGIIYVLNHPNSVTQFVDCSQIVNCDPAQDCNKHKTGSQCQIEDQTFTPVLLLSNGNDMSTKVTNPTNTQDSDSGADISQNSSEATRAVLSEGESQPAQSNCPVMDIDEFRTNNIASATSLEQQHIADVVESNSAVLLEKHNILFESQHQNSNTLLLEKNCEISNYSGGSSASLTDDHIHQKSVVVLPEIDCTSGAVLVERNSELHRDEHSKTGLAKGLPLQSCSDSMSAYPLQNDPTDENNNSEGVLPTGNQLLSHQNCGIEQLSDSCWVSQSTGANGASYVDQQGASGSEHKGSHADLCQRSMDSEEEPSSKDDGLSVGEDSLSDKSDPFVLTCEDAGDNAAIFLEEAEDNFSETSEVDLIMLGCNDSHESDQQNDSETAPFNVATSSPQVQSPSEEQNSNASKDHGVPAVVLLEGNQHSFKNGKQRSKSFDEIIQKNSEDVHKKSSDVVIEESSKESCRKSSSKDACRALRSFRCEEAVITKVDGANLATFSATNDSGVSPNCSPMVLCPHGSALILADKLTSEENSKVKTKLKKSKPTRNAKTKASSAVESQGLHVTPPDIIAQNRNGNDKTISSGGVTELSLNRSKEKSEGNFKKSRLRETSHSGMETVEPAEVNSSTEHTRTLKNRRSGIKLRIVKVRRGVWKAQSSTDPATQQHCSQKEKSVASASNDDCTAAAASENLSTNPDGIYISDESDTDSQDCFCIDESCLPNHRLRTSPNRTIINQMTTSTRLHRFGCTCVTCAEQQFLYGRDNTMSLFMDVNLTRDISLRRALMRYKQRFMPANRSPSSQVCSVTPIAQSPVVIDDLDGSNSEMPIHIS